jgi:hypothetical protein
MRQRGVYKALFKRVQEMAQGAFEAELVHHSFTSLLTVTSMSIPQRLRVSVAFDYTLRATTAALTQLTENAE